MEAEVTARKRPQEKLELSYRKIIDILVNGPIEDFVKLAILYPILAESFDQIYDFVQVFTGKILDHPKFELVVKFVGADVWGNEVFHNFAELWKGDTIRLKLVLQMFLHSRKEPKSPLVTIGGLRHWLSHLSHLQIIYIFNFSFY